jgi:hypothetical protein
MDVFEARSMMANGSGVMYVRCEPLDVHAAAPTVFHVSS